MQKIGIETSILEQYPQGHSIDNVEALCPYLEIKV